MASQQVALPVIDWTTGCAARLLSSVSQACNLAVRRCQRFALRGGKGKLVAAKELNTSGAAGSAANQQWRGQRALTGLAKEEAKAVPRQQLGSVSGPPFAALPFLSSQELLAAVGRELQLPQGDALLTPLLALDSPCFAATPVVQEAVSPAAEASSGDGGSNSRSHACSVSATRDTQRSRHPLSRFARLEPLHQGATPPQQASAHKLRTALLAWSHLFAPAAPKPAPEAASAANARLRDALVQYAKLAC